MLTSLDRSDKRNRDADFAAHPFGTWPFARRADFKNG